MSRDKSPTEPPPSAPDLPEQDDQRGRTARVPKDIPAAGLRDVLFRVGRQIEKDNLSIVAAGIAFFWFLALFPALGATVSIYGLVADPVAVEGQLREISAALPREARDLVMERTRALVSQPDAGLQLGALIGIVLAIWSGNRGVNALLIGLNIAYDEKDGRGFFKQLGVSLAITTALVLFACLCVGALVILPVALAVAAEDSWIELALPFLRWPLLALSLMTGLGFAYSLAPHRRPPKWRWASWGSAVAVVLWLLASWAFSKYVELFGNFDETYGSLGAIAVTLLWLYMSAFVVLLGAELNSELEHQTVVDTTTGPDREMGKRGAYVADHVGETPDKMGRLDWLGPDDERDGGDEAPR